MKCEQIKRLLSPYVDGMVDDKEKELVEAHIVICTECRQQVDDYRRIGSMMQQLEPPSLPVDFAANLNRRVLDEQNKIMGSYTLKTPKKSGWIAAALAVFALTGGIYASSHWSLGSFVTAWHDSKDNEKKPLISIDSIIERFQNWKDIDDSKADSTDAVSQDDNNKMAMKTPPPPIKKTEDTPPSSSSIDDNSVDNMSSYSSTLKVENIEDTLPQLIKIAVKYGAGYAIIPAEDNMAADSRQIPRGILLEVEQSEAYNIIKELEALGSQPDHKDTALWLQARDRANEPDSANQNQPGNEEPGTETPAGQTDSSEPKLLMKQDTSPNQPDAVKNDDNEKINNDNDNNNNSKKNKVAISVNFVQEIEQVKP